MGKAFSDLYDSLDSKDGQSIAIRIAKCKHRKSVDMYQVKLIKDENGKVLYEEEVKERWKIYFEQLMNVENENRMESGTSKSK